MDFEGSLEGAEALWTDPESWPAWVEGFASFVRRDGAWPAPGAALEWRSGPAGRGTVSERVMSRVPGAELVSEFSDGRMRGVQRVTFEPLDGGVAIELELDYTLSGMRLGAALLDALFIRRAIRDSLTRTLQRFGRELAAQRL